MLRNTVRILSRMETFLSARLHGLNLNSTRAIQSCCRDLAQSKAKGANKKDEDASKKDKGAGKKDKEANKKDKGAGKKAKGAGDRIKCPLVASKHTEGKVSDY
jgi:hypothetical protein